MSTTSNMEDYDVLVIGAGKATLSYDIVTSDINHL